MASFWQRLRRLWHEPRIRLPGPGLRPRDLHCGDRLEIGPRLWRITARLDAARPGASFELSAEDGPPDRSCLRITAGRWTLDDRPGALDPAAVIHYPVCASPKN